MDSYVCVFERDDKDFLFFSLGFEYFGRRIMVLLSGCFVYFVISNNCNNFYFFI